MKTRILILACEPRCLTPIFREPALLRLARLAASLADEALLLATEEVYRSLSSDFARLPASVSWQVVPGAGSLTLPAPLSADEPLVVLKGHVVWDRAHLGAILGTAERDKEVSASWGGILPAGASEATVRKWLTEPEEAFSSAPRLLPYLISPGEEGAREAESRLVAAQAEITRESDGFLTRLVDRRISRKLSPPLARRGVRPNWITLMATAVGLTGAWLLAQVSYGAHLAGALLFLGAVIMDGVDGEVARLTLRETNFGHYLDVITDNLVHVAIFIGLALGLSRATGDASHLYALLGLLGGFGLCALSVYQVLLKPGHSPEFESRATRWLEVLANRDFAYLVVFLALIDRLGFFLWGAMIGTYVFALGLWVLGRSSWQKAGTGGPRK